MERKPTKVVTGGILAQKWQPEWELYVSSPAEAIRAIDANTKGEFRRFLLGEGAKGMYKIAIGHEDNCLDAEELHNPSGQNTIYILPVVAGAKSAIGKIVAAIIIAVITYYTFGAGAGAAGGGWAGLGGSSTLANIGYMTAASLALQGIVQLVTPVPSFNANNQSADATRSNLIGGNATAISQGQAIPLVYGRMRVNPLPISISYTASDRSAVNSFASQEYSINYGAGGLVEYTPIPILPEDNLPDPTLPPE